MNRGEVCLVSLPFTSGHEQGGQRPVVIQDAAYGQGSPLVLAVPLTSQLARYRLNRERQSRKPADA